MIRELIGTVQPSPADNGASQGVLDEARDALDYQASGLGWLKWIAIGRGLQECQKLALERARSNDLKSGAYRKAMSLILEAERLDRIDKGDRSVLLAVVAELPAITAWRDTLTVTERMRYNHPRAVMTRFKKATTKPPVLDVTAEAVIPASRGYKAAFQIAEVTISELKQQLHTAQAKRSLIDLQFDPPEQIARVVLGNVDAKRAESIGFAIVQALRDPPPRDDSKSTPVSKRKTAQAQGRH